MDGQRFDAFTRALTTSADRRRVLRKVIVGLGGVLGLAEVRPGLAQPQPKVGICHVDGQGRYRYQEVNGNAVPAHAAHGDAIDPDFNSDPDHCGGCGLACGAGLTCEAGGCVAGGPVIVTGSLDGTDPIFTAPGCNPGRPYDAYPFDHPGGALSLAVRGGASGGGTLPDTAVYLYAGGSVPSDACNWVAFDDDNGCGLDAYLETTQPAGTYTAVVVEVFGELGSYTFARNTFTGPEFCG